MSDNYLTRDFIKEKKLMILSVTKRCNLACEYCRKYNNGTYDVLSKISDNLELEEDTWERIDKIARENNVAEIMFTGGEPFEYRKTVELCEFLTNRNHHVSIHTNGVSKNIDYVLGKFKEKELLPDFHVSTELFEEHQKELRGAELPIGFIKKSIAQGHRVELKVTLNNLLLQKIDDLKECLYDWVDLGVESIRIQPLVDVNSKMRRDITLTEGFIKVVEMLVDFKQNDKVLSNVLRNNDVSFEALLKVLRHEKVNEKIIHQCCADKGIVFVTTNLELKNCKTIWNRNPKQNCMQYFDLVCCGFLS